MSHLKKKIEGELYDLGFKVFVDREPLINNKCLRISERDDSRKFFYYLYDINKNLKENLNKIIKEAQLYLNYKKIENCKFTKKYIKENEYNECLKNCFYSIYCKMKETYNGRTNMSKEIWDINKRERIEQPKEMKEFIDEIIKVMEKYNLSISHEDTHGAFIIEKYDKYNIEWLKDAMKNF